MRKIRINLNQKSIDRAIRQIEEYKNFLNERIPVFLKRLAEEGVAIAKVRFETATYDGDNDVNVSMEQRDDNTVAIVAKGKSTLFIEFGSGARYVPDHPDKAADEFYPGSWSEGEYGKGHWDNPKGWWYESGKHSYGNPANACMYYTKEDLKVLIKTIAAEVFDKEVFQ